MIANLRSYRKTVCKFDLHAKHSVGFLIQLGPSANFSRSLQPMYFIIWLVGLPPPLPWDRGMARTAIQVHAINLIKLG